MVEESSAKFTTVLLPFGSTTVVVHVDPGPGVPDTNAREYCQHEVLALHVVLAVSILVRPAVEPSAKMPVLLGPPL